MSENETVGETVAVESEFEKAVRDGYAPGQWERVKRELKEGGVRLGRRRSGYPGHVEERERNTEMWKMHREGGVPLRQLADLYGLSRTRVKDIVRRYDREFEE